MTVYAIFTRDSRGTPFDILFGQEDVVFAWKSEADTIADYLNTDQCWGPAGDQTAIEVGMEYYVEEMDVEALEGPWRDQAISEGWIDGDEE